MEQQEYGIRYKVFAPGFTTDFYTYNSDGTSRNMSLDKTARQTAKKFTLQEASETMQMLRDHLPTIFPDSIRIEIQRCRRPSWRVDHKITCIR